MPTRFGLARVVDVNVPTTPPMVKVVTTFVLLLELDVWRTVMVSAATTVPAVPVYPPPFLEYVPLETVMVAAALMPEMVMAGVDVIVAVRATPVCGVKPKASGVVSGTGAASIFTLMEALQVSRPSEQRNTMA
jgi:hypothetical protein